MGRVITAGHAAASMATACPAINASPIKLPHPSGRSVDPMQTCQMLCVEENRLVVTLQGPPTPQCQHFCRAPHDCAELLQLPVPADNR